MPFKGLINDHALRWNALTALVCLGWADQNTDIARENQSDPSSSGSAPRGDRQPPPMPLPIVKIRAWEVINEAAALSNDVLSAIISGFVAPTSRAAH